MEPGVHFPETSRSVNRKVNLPGHPRLPLPFLFAGVILADGNEKTSDVKRLWLYLDISPLTKMQKHRLFSLHCLPLSGAGPHLSPEKQCGSSGMTWRIRKERSTSAPSHHSYRPLLKLSSHLKKKKKKKGRWIRSILRAGAVSEISWLSLKKKRTAHEYSSWQVYP